MVYWVLTPAFGPTPLIRHIDTIRIKPTVSTISFGNKLVGMQMPSFVYCYHLPNINCIKVGFGDNPKFRMTSYTRNYGLEADNRSLREWSLPIAGIANHIEKRCHETFIELGLHSKRITNSESEAQEVFQLFNVTYDEAIKIIEEVVQGQIQELLFELGARKKATVRNKAQDEAKEKFIQRATLQQEEVERLTSECALLIRNVVAPKTFIPLRSVLEDAQQLTAKIPLAPKKRFLDFGKPIPTAQDLFFSWEHRFELVNIIARVFRLDRNLRYTQLALYSKYYKAPGGNYMNVVSHAAALEGFDFWRPAPAFHTYNHFQILFSLDEYKTRSEVACREVEHITQSLGVPNAKRFIQECDKLRQLQMDAKTDQPPELMDEFSFLTSPMNLEFMLSLKAT